MFNAGPFNSGPFNDIGSTGVVRSLGGKATARFGGRLYPYDVILYGEATTVSVASQTALIRVRPLSAVASCGVSSDTPHLLAARIMAASASATIASHASPDAIIGGVRNVLMSGHAFPVVNTTVTIDPKRFASGKALASVAIAAAITRTQKLRGAGAIGVSTGVKLGATRLIASLANTFGVSTAQAPLKRTGMLKVTGDVGVSSTMTGAGVQRFVFGSARAVVSSTMVKPDTFLAIGGQCHASVSTAAASMRRVGKMSCSALALVSSGAYVALNYFEREPYFRTLTIEPEIWSMTVEPQPFTLRVLDDVSEVAYMEQ